MRRQILLAVIAFRHAFAANDAQPCYFPNGTSMENTPFHPCFSGQDSQCCWENEVCMSNGLCFSPSKGIPYRGGCTDKTWKTAACPNLCTDSIPNGWADLKPCPLNSNGQWQWWCGVWQDTAVCSSGPNSSFFDYPSGNFVKVITTNTTNTTTGTAAAPSATNSQASGVNSSLGPTCPPLKETSGAAFKAETVLVVLFALLALVLGLLLWEQNKKIRKALSAGASGPYGPHDEKSAIPASAIPQHAVGQPVFELGGGQGKGPLLELASNGPASPSRGA